MAVSMFRMKRLLGYEAKMIDGGDFKVYLLLAENHASSLALTYFGA